MRCNSRFRLSVLSAFAFSHGPKITAPFSGSHDRAALANEALGTPGYGYDQNSLEANAAAVLKFPNAFGLTARYAMKASPNEVTEDFL